jgi:hypothetical protein
MLRCSPPKPPFAAIAKSGEASTPELREKATVAFKLRRVRFEGDIPRPFQ